ncbi:MAG: prepilin-type N-terminal cleavage/methylation domain-containing protein [Candidatus Riflebacteria bacterium]|nr:prepilin-type N-terminal cleavage/methylation domain-containing protein [Candidatus Riflebacteria bacterium]
MISIFQKNKQHRGFSLIEVLIGMVIMSVALLSFFLINQTSSSQSMDAYYEFLAQTLGNETVEFCQGMGYAWALKYMDKPDIFPLNEWHGILDKPIFSKTSYFRECDSFERMVNMSKISGGGEGILVTIGVRVKSNNKVRAWMSRSQLQFATIVMEKPAR